MIQRNGVFLVTGASAGLGKAITTGLARQGATVVMVARNRVKNTITLPKRAFMRQLENWAMICVRKTERLRASQLRIGLASQLSV